MYINLSKGSRKTNRSKCKRHRAKIKAKNRRRQARVHQRGM